MSNIIPDGRASESNPAVAIIGAGFGGIATAKALDDAGITWECYEERPRVGGIWSQETGTESGPAYRSLHVNSSAWKMALSGLPMPEDYPDFPSQKKIGEYVNRYVERFGLLRNIHLGTGVTSLEPLASDGWVVETADRRRRHYESVVISTGYAGEPSVPEVPGSFSGEVIHARDYTSPERFAGRNVLIVGLGVSGAEIACEVSPVASRTVVAMRTGVHVVPKHLFGRPFDTIPVPTRPQWLRWKLLRLAIRLSRGPQERYGITPPDRPFGKASATVTSELLSRLSHGDITTRPALSEFKEDSVVYADGSIESFDTVILCTGYRPSFPFLDPCARSPRDGLDLFRRVFHPTARNLAFIGLAQVLGATPPVLELQARLVAAKLSGGYALPGEGDMVREIARDRARAAATYGSVPRGGMLLDPPAYRALIKRELRDGARRARLSPTGARAAGRG